MSEYWMNDGMFCREFILAYTHHSGLNIEAEFKTWIEFCKNVAYGYI